MKMKNDFFQKYQLPSAASLIKTPVIGTSNWPLKNRCKPIRADATKKYVRWKIRFAKQVENFFANETRR